MDGAAATPEHPMPSDRPLDHRRWTMDDCPFPTPNTGGSLGVHGRWSIVHRLSAFLIPHEFVLRYAPCALRDALNSCFTPCAMRFALCAKFLFYAMRYALCALR